MRLILEGIDGAGKSSILEAVAKSYRLKVGELGKPPKSVTPLQWADYFREAYDNFSALSRCHVSEQVYGTLIRGKSLIDPWQAWLLEMQLRALDFQLFYVEADNQEIATRLMLRKDASDYDKWVVDHLPQMRKAYREFLPMDMTTVIENNGALGLAVAKVLARVRPNPPRLRGIGYLSPRVFVVGEEFTSKRHSVPFARPFDSGEAAKMVYEALKGIPDVYITNALFPDLGPIRSQHNLIKEYGHLGGKVIAVGSIARDACRQAGIQIDAYLAHPQYWRRFKYANREEWVAMMRTAAEHFRG